VRVGVMPGKGGLWENKEANGGGGLRERARGEEEGRSVETRNIA